MTVPTVGQIAESVADSDDLAGAAKALNVPVGAGTADLGPYPVVVMGLCVKAGGTACVVELYNAESASGDLVAVLGVAASSAGSVWFGDKGVHCPSGLSAVLTGSPAKVTALIRHVV